MINMIDMREPTKEDYKKFNDALYFAEKQENSKDGYYMIVMFDDREKLLQVIDRQCFLYTLGYDHQVDQIEFTLDEDYDLEFCAISQDYAVVVDKVDEDRDHDEFRFVNQHTGNVEEFAFFGRDEDDKDGYNAFAVYTQYNDEKDIKLAMTYQHMFFKHRRVYKYHLNNPALLTIERYFLNGTKSKKEQYVKKNFKFDEDPVFYKLATMKDQGFFKTLSEGALRLNLNADFSRYYKVMRETPKDFKIAFPFGSQYTIEDVNEYIKSLGFNTYVPDEVVDFYNGDNTDFQEVLSTARLLKLVYAEVKEQLLKLELTKDDGNGSN